MPPVQDDDDEGYRLGGTSPDDLKLMGFLAQLIAAYPGRAVTICLFDTVDDREMAIAGTGADDKAMLGEVIARLQYFHKHMR